MNSPTQHNRSYKTFNMNLFFSIFILTIVPLTIIAFSFKFINVKSIPYFYNIILEHKANIRGQSNDIVFIGDSACLNGIIPATIEQETGLKTINLGLTAVTGIMGYDIILSRYLRHNKKPKLIVFYISANSPNSFKIKSYDSVLTSTKYFDIKSYIRYFPIYNPFHVLSASITFFQGWYKDRQDYETTLRTLIEHKGYFPNVARSLAADQVLDSTTQNQQLFETTEDPRKLITQFVQHFSRQGIKVILYIAPLPQGDQGFTFFKEVYYNFSANQIEQYPNHYFTDYTHMTVAGAQINSKNTARFLIDHVF